MRVVLAVLTLVFASHATAQVAGMSPGFFIGGSNSGAGASRYLQLDASNNPTTITVSGVWGNSFGLDISPDNLKIIKAGLATTVSSPLTTGLFEYDVAGGTWATIWSGLSSTMNFTNIANVAVDCDGDIWTIDNAVVPEVLVKYDRFNGTFSHFPLGALATTAGISGLEWDKLTGGLNHAQWGAPSALYKTDYTGANTTLVGAAAARVSRYGGTMTEDGTWISSTCCTNQYYSVDTAGTWTAGPTASGTIAYDVTNEKFAAPGRGVWVANFSPPNVSYIDLVSGTVTVTYTPGTGEWPGTGYEIVPLNNRDMATERTGKATWRWNYNPGNGLGAGNQYVVGASLVPVPAGGIALSDNRQIFIGLDPLLLLCVVNAAGPFVQNTVGTLGPAGASGNIDLSSLSSALNGQAIHFVAVTLDPSATDGIGHVSDPWCLIVEILP